MSAETVRSDAAPPPDAVARLWIVLRMLLPWIDALSRQHVELLAIVSSLGRLLAECGIVPPESVSRAVRRAQGEAWLATSDPDHVAQVFLRVCQGATAAELAVLATLPPPDAAAHLVALDAEIRRRAAAGVEAAPIGEAPPA